jgi:hypothetical protein
MYTTKLLVQKEKRKIVVSKNTQISKYFLNKKKVNLREVTSMLKPYNNKFLWVFFEPFNSLSNVTLTPFNYLQTTLIKQKYSTLFPYYSISSFHSENLLRCSSRLLTSNQEYFLEPLLDQHEQFLFQQVSINQKQKRQRYNTIVAEAERTYKQQVEKLIDPEISWYNSLNRKKTYLKTFHKLLFHKIKRSHGNGNKFYTKLKKKTIASKERNLFFSKQNLMVSFRKNSKQFKKVEKWIHIVAKVLILKKYLPKTRFKTSVLFLYSYLPFLHLFKTVNLVYNNFLRKLKQLIFFSLKTRKYFFLFLKKLSKYSIIYYIYYQKYFSSTRILEKKKNRNSVLASVAKYIRLPLDNPPLTISKMYFHKSPSLYRNEKEEEELDLFYTKPSNSFLPNFKTISAKPQFFWIQNMSRILRWRLFTVNKTKSFQLFRQIFALFFKKTQRKKKIKYKYSQKLEFLNIFLLNFLTTPTSKPIPMNLHKVFLFSIQQFFSGFTAKYLVPSYYNKRLHFIQNYDFAKPIRIVFSRYKERRRSFQVNILNHTNENIFTSWPGFVIKRISQIIGYQQSHKYTFLRFMKPKSAKRNFMARILVMRHLTNFIFTNFKKTGGVFEIVLKLNVKLFENRPILRLLENLINTGDPTIELQRQQDYYKRRSYWDSKQQSLKKKKTRSYPKNTVFFLKKKRYNTRPLHLRHIRIFGKYLIFIRKMLILLLFLFIKKPYNFSNILLCFKKLNNFQTICRFYIKILLSSTFLRTTQIQQKQRALKKMTTFRPFRFFKRQLRRGFYATNRKYIVSKISIFRAVRYGKPLKKTRQRRL